tara:strand:- start:141 stop:305 length:165 start_codon:yes stop_codon:yes gene_type:complete
MGEQWGDYEDINLTKPEKLDPKLPKNPAKTVFVRTELLNLDSFFRDCRNRPEHH